MMQDSAGPPPAPGATERSGNGTAPEESQGSSLLARLFGWREEAPEPRPRPEESDGGTATHDIAHRLREMRGKRVDDIMIPRADIVAVADDISPEALIAVFRETAITRLPVYRGTLDDPVGFLHLKDLALRHGFVAAPAAFEIASLVRPILYIPASMPLVTLLRKMQRERCHMALVIDEYGGVDGLVTFEDLVEEIVGEIEDEHDTEDPAPWRVEAPGVYDVEARTELDAFRAATGIDLRPDDTDEEVDTVGGLVFTLAGRVPAAGETVDHPDGHVIEVTAADPRHIDRVRLRLAAAPEADRAAE